MALDEGKPSFRDGDDAGTSLRTFPITCVFTIITMVAIQMNMMLLLTMIITAVPVVMASLSIITLLVTFIGAHRRHTVPLACRRYRSRAAPGVDGVADLHGVPGRPVVLEQP